MFRPAILVAAAFLLAVPVSPATAQDPGGHVLTDVRDDVIGQVAPAPAAPVSRSSIDLLALDVSETPETVSFTTTSASLPQLASSDFEGVFVSTNFTHRGRTFEIEVLLAHPSIEPTVVTWISYRDPGDPDWSQIVYSRNLTVADRTAGTLTTPLPREMLADKDGAVPLNGRSLTDINVVSSTRASSNPFLNGDDIAKWPLSLGDSMPDAGAALGSYAVTFGPPQDGHAALSSASPFRSSNGEATTYVYNVTLENRGTAEDRFEFTVPSTPHGYAVNFPIQAVSIPAGGSQTVPVLLTMPFGHQHGTAASFMVEAQSLTDAGSRGRVELGVRYLAVPQPAGHHDTVYFHSHRSKSSLPEPPVQSEVLSAGYLTMNTREDDESDNGETVTARFATDSAAGTIQRVWPIELNPTLALGLDVDPQKVGSLSVPFKTTTLLRDVHFSGRLCIGEEADPWECEALAAAPDTSVPDVSPNGEFTAQAPLLPLAGPRHPFRLGTTLWLEVNLTYTDPASGSGYTRFGPEVPSIRPGGSAVLPLQEWHDEPAGSLTFGGPALVSVGPQERLANPGRTAQFPVTVTNPSDQSAKVVLAVSGLHEDWTDLAPAQLALPAHGSADVLVNVHVPADQPDGARADLMLQAYAAEHPEALGLLRLVLEADTDADHPDEARSAAKDSPSTLAPMLAAALLVAALATRRR